MAIRVVQREDRAAAGNAGEDEAAAVGLPASRRLDELQALEVRVHRGPGDLPIHLARAPVGQEEVDREQVAVGQEHEPVALRAQGGADVVAPVAMGSVTGLHQAHADALRRLGVVFQMPVCLGSRGEHRVVAAVADPTGARVVRVAEPELPRLGVHLAEGRCTEPALEIASWFASSFPEKRSSA